MGDASGWRQIGQMEIDDVCRVHGARIGQGDDERLGDGTFVGEAGFGG